MPKHVMQYDFKDFERFVREDLERQGYALATGAKPEITDLSQIQDFDDMGQLMEQVIISVLVVPFVQSPAIAVPVPAAAKPSPNQPDASKKSHTLSGKDHNRTKHGYYSNNIERTPEEEEERREYFREERRIRREKERAKKAATNGEAAPVPAQNVPVENIQVLPVQEVVAPSTAPFPGSGTGISTGAH